MTRTAKLLLLGGVATFGLAAAAAADAGGRGGHHWRGHGGGFGPGLFETFDANGDGRLTQAEVDQARQGRLAEFDQNGDGNLSLDEYQALWMDAMRERMVDRFQALDDDADATVTGEEFLEPYGRMISRLDADDDGEITTDELRRRGERRGDDGDDDERD